MKESHFNFSLIFAGVCIAVGLTFGGYNIGRSLEKFKTRDKTVVVKGLSERVVKSDLALWKLSFKNSGNDLSALEEKTAMDAKTIRSFLFENGFDKSEIKEESINVLDKAAREYGENQPISQRFIIEGNFSIRTEQVDRVAKTAQQMGELIKKGIIISGEQSYYYTKFKDIRPQMIEESTKSARQAAEQFAKDSGSKIGCIRTAQQGTFTITGLYNHACDFDYNEAKSVEKNIRMVSTVTFSIE